jgi:hypothetical protein
MVNTELRRVKRLRLSASTDASLLRGQILAEDALRTASLPNASGGRVLVVRSLKLGVIRSRQSAASLALAIEEALYRLGPEAIYAEDPSAGESPLVYFRDEVEPYVRLALRIARGQSVAGWFWPLAVSFWRPTMPGDEALRSLLGATLGTEAGAAAAVALVRELFEQQALEPLLSALRWQEGPALLKACGWSQHAGLPFSLPETQASESVGQALSTWGALLAIWGERWGVDDARSNWLAATALAAIKPARLQDQRLMSQARQLIRLATGSTQAARAAQHSPHGEQKDVTPRTATTLAAEHETRRLNVARGSEPFAPTPFAARDAVADAEDNRALDETNREALQGEATPDSSPPASVAEARAFAPLLSEDRESAARAPARFEGIPRPTDYAGLFFLIPVLSRLGMAAMLEANPHLIEYDLPERFLSFVGARFGIPDDDPVASLLVAHKAEPAPSRCEFIVPASWRAGLCRRGPLVVRRRRDERGARALCDSTGKLTLALWRGRVPEGVRSLAGDGPLRRSAAPQSEDLRVLLESWLVAARRWCRRFARIGIRELVCRAGRVSQTRTHVDVLFEHGQADVRVRKAGLDINPGWVAWLGRVLTFYYLYGEQGNGY